MITSVVEIVSQVGIPIYALPEQSLFFVWNESSTVFLYQEHGGEIEEVDVRNFMIENCLNNIGEQFNRALTLAKDWGDEIRQEAKEV